VYAGHGIDRADYGLPTRRVVGDHLPGARFQKVEVRDLAAVVALDVLFRVGAERLVEGFDGRLLRDAELPPDGSEQDVPQAQGHDLLLALRDGELARALMPASV
jgi:hypothetical protein